MERRTDSAYHLAFIIAASMAFVSIICAQMIRRYRSVQDPVATHVSGPRTRQATGKKSHGSRLVGARTLGSPLRYVGAPLPP